MQFYNSLHGEIEERFLDYVPPRAQTARRKRGGTSLGMTTRGSLLVALGFEVEDGERGQAQIQGIGAFIPRDWLGLHTT